QGGTLSDAAAAASLYSLPRVLTGEGKAGRLSFVRGLLGVGVIWAWVKTEQPRREKSPCNLMRVHALARKCVVEMAGTKSHQSAGLMAIGYASAATTASGVASNGSTRTLGPTGAHCSGELAGPNRATVGTPRTAARWVGPLSLPTYPRASLRRR